MTENSKKIGLTIELGEKSKLLLIGLDWTVEQMYKFVAVDMTNAEIDTFYLLNAGQPLDDMTKLVRDCHFMHGQKLLYVQRNHGGSGLQPLPGHIELTDEPCCMTYDGDSSQKRAKMPCGCAFAPGTLTNYCTVTVNKGETTFKCPNCERPWEFFLLRHVMSADKSADELNAIVRRLDANFVRRPQQDVRQCMMCKTYSQRDFTRPWYENRERAVCNVCSKKNRRTVEFCWRCGLEWRGGDGTKCGNPNCSGPVEKLHTLTTCATKDIYPNKCVPVTRACPGCGTLITHVDQCKHMTCECCRCNFCFVCLKTKDANGPWPCGEDAYGKCLVAPRQTAIPTNNNAQ